MLAVAIGVVSGFPGAVPLARAEPPTSGFPATVLSIGDGDTLRVRRGEQPITIRLACIDAPELAQSPWGQQARAYLQTRLPLGSRVSVLPQTTDRFGRTVAEVISGININLAMVEDGQAFAYRRYLSGCQASEYLQAEFRASRHRHGVWQVAGGITRPWEFRHGHHDAVLPDGTTPGGHRYRCREIGSHARAQVLLRAGHTYLDGNGDGQACESLPH